jgi:hypothetical protein
VFGHPVNSDLQKWIRPHGPDALYATTEQKVAGFKAPRVTTLPVVRIEGIKASPGLRRTTVQQKSTATSPSGIDLI